MAMRRERTRSPFDQARLRASCCSSMCLMYSPCVIMLLFRDRVASFSSSRRLLILVSSASAPPLLEASSRKFARTAIRLFVVYLRRIRSLFTRQCSKSAWTALFAVRALRPAAAADGDAAEGAGAAAGALLSIDRGSAPVCTGRAPMAISRSGSSITSCFAFSMASWRFRSRSRSALAFALASAEAVASASSFLASSSALSFWATRE
mmetsp:Transcript_502/g.1220  ORF Transcript_502/g.1220 Transcript_502/m.1220 type:complete len:207 (-) Transcript_502:149-769(-)